MPAPLDHYAKLRPLEETVLALWNDGLTVERIAERLGKRVEDVGVALKTALGGTDHLKFHARNRKATAQLGAAIRAYQEARA